MSPRIEQSSRLVRLATLLFFIAATVGCRQVKNIDLKGCWNIDKWGVNDKVQGKVLILYLKEYPTRIASADCPRDTVIVRSLSNFPEGEIYTDFYGTDTSVAVISGTVVEFDEKNRPVVNLDGVKYSRRETERR